MSPVSHFVISIYYIVIQHCCGVKIGSYNTGQLGQLTESAVDHNEAIQQQMITDIIESDLDVICLQELSELQTLQLYTQQLSQQYIHSFSELNVYDFQPRAPCSAEQVSLISTGCINIENCNDLWPSGEEWIGCMGRKCPNTDTFNLFKSQCIFCTGFYPLIIGDPTATLQDALIYCQDVLNFPTDLFDGTAIFSKYPILNTWYIEYESWAYIQRAISITEIDICDITQPYALKNDCSDSMIVGCVHLSATDWIDPQFVYFQSSDLQIKLNIDTHIKLNAFQTEFILNNITKKDIAPWNNDEDINDVKAVFIAGDINVGNTLNSENFDIWRENGFISVRELKKIGSVDNGCTYCADPKGTDLPNMRANEFCMTNPCLLQDSDIDHILIETDKVCKKNKGKIKSIKPILYDRIFTDLYDFSDPKDNDNAIPLSDHWGVVFQFEFKSEKKKKKHHHHHKRYHNRRHHKK